MYGGTHRITFEVQIVTENLEDYKCATSIIEERMARVVDHDEIRTPKIVEGGQVIQRGSVIARVIKVIKR